MSLYETGFLTKFCVANFRDVIVKNDTVSFIYFMTGLNTGGSHRARYY